MPPGGIKPLSHVDILRFEEIEKIVNCATEWGIDKVRITGGEPLVRKGIVHLIEKLANLKGINDLSMTTNGVLLEDFARDLKNAGLHRINISLDSLDPDKFQRITRCRKLSGVQDGIEEALKRDLKPVKINVVVLKGINDDEVLDFARMSLAQPLHVRFIEFMPPVPKRSFEFVPTSAIKERIEELGKLIPTALTSAGPAKTFKFEKSPGTIGFITPMSEHFCSHCNRLRLAADGRLYPCLFSPSGVDIKSSLRKGAGCSQIRESFEQVLKTKAARYSLNGTRQMMSRIGG
jgi:cyclic pyranopterin phosphate synthase